MLAIESALVVSSQAQNSWLRAATLPGRTLQVAHTPYPAPTVRQARMVPL